MAFGLEAPQVSSTAQHAIPGLRDELAQRGLAAELMEADVSSSADVAKVVERALARFGRIDAVVNNAAIGPLGTVLDTDEEVFDRIIAVNLKGPYLTSRAAVPHMIAQGGGSIVNIGSGAGWGKPNMAVYSASKGGVAALSTAMAYDFFHQRIRVNTVIPGGGGIVSGMSLGRVGGDAARLRQRRARHRRGPGRHRRRHRQCRGVPAVAGSGNAVRHRDRRRLLRAAGRTDPCKTSFVILERCHDGDH